MGDDPVRAGLSKAGQEEPRHLPFSSEACRGGVVSDQVVRRTILINMKSQMHSCDNWSTGESVSTVQERDKRLPRTAGTSR